MKAERVDSGLTAAVFGGSFNPPHRSHETVIASVLQHAVCDSVWLIPTHSHPFGKTLAPFEHRLRMCQLAFAGRTGDMEPVTSRVGHSGPGVVLVEARDDHLIQDAVLGLVGGAETEEIPGL